jgi:hypothetical protein
MLMDETFPQLTCNLRVLGDRDSETFTSRVESSMKDKEVFAKPKQEIYIYLRRFDLFPQNRS